VGVSQESTCGVGRKKGTRVYEDDGDLALGSFLILRFYGLKYALVFTAFQMMALVVSGRGGNLPRLDRVPQLI
jgi:hypothetical protein